MEQKLFLFLILGVIIVSPLFWVTIVDYSQNSEPEFFVGAEYAIDDYSVEVCKALVDKVKNFTNVYC